MSTLTLQKHFSETPDVDTFIFEPDDPIDFEPGQFLQYTLPHDNPDSKGIKRYFTIAAAPSEGVIQITTRFTEPTSSFKLALRAMQPGQTIQVGPPSGDFTYPNPTTPAVFIAGGIGITPYRSILVELNHKGIDSPITLIYTNRNDHIAFRQLFDNMAGKFQSFRVLYVVDPQKIDARYITENIPDLNTPRFYISGPEPMVEAFSKMFTQELDVPREQLEHDFFPGYTEI